MKNKVMLAVCMPAYNAEAHIAKAISSILAQTYKNFKFVITDDGSTDKTIDVINSFDHLYGSNGCG
jgi:glycosyltransferase involved in cell wall biosynthesis